MKATVSTLILLFVSVFTLNASAGDTAKYYEAMGKTLPQYATCQTADDFYTLSLKFGRIAKAEPDQWLAKYYQAHTIVLSNFMSAESPAIRDAKLAEAQALVDNMKKIESADQSEVMALQGMLYTSQLVIDPANRGQKYSAKSGQALAEALKLNPNNPRAQYLVLSNAHGSAQWFGKDLAPFCAQANELLENWDAMNVSTEPMKPSWGKDQVVGIANSCN